MNDRKGALGMVLAAAILGGVVWVGLNSSDDEPQVTLTLAERYLLDGRLDAIIYDCHFGRTFDAPLADMVPLLVSKLEHGTKEPLRQAKFELGVIGGGAMPELTRLWNQASSGESAKWKHGVLENILQAVNQMPGPEGLPLLRKAMIHPVGSVRLAALPALGRYGDKSDYDLVALWLPALTIGDTQANYAEVMASLDWHRYLDEVAGWMEIGQYPGLWNYLVLDVAACRDPEQAERFKGLAALRDEQYVPFLMAPAAALGDEDAMEELLERLHHERPGTRQFAVQALGAIGETGAIASLVHDEHAGVRRLVVMALLKDGSDLATEYLRDACKDPDKAVRKLAFTELVGRGHELTVAEALALLEGNLLERGLATDALRRAWNVNEGSAQKAYERLIALWRSEKDDAGERISVLQSLGHVPLEEAATFLLDFGRQYDGDIKGQSAHRWACGQVWNTGRVGRSLLRATLEAETDPFRRLDLIEYIWQDHSDAARETLMGVLLDDQVNPYERLFVADRLTRLGPAEVVAPAIKRVYLACTHQDVRPALQCLLWVWYGQHDFG